jgi:hypothetical protein
LARHAGKVLGKVLAHRHGAAQGRGHSSTLRRARYSQQSAGQGWVHGVGQGQVHIGFKPLKQRFGYTKARIVTGDSLPLYSFDKQTLCRFTSEGLWPAQPPTDMENRRKRQLAHRLLS